MRQVTKEDLDPLIREIAVLLAEKYPDLPFTVGIHTSDGQNFARAASHYLQNDVNQMRAYAEYIKHVCDIQTRINEIDQQMRMLAALDSIPIRKDTTVN